MAQSVAHLIGSEEVTGPIPVISLQLAAEVPVSYEIGTFYCEKARQNCERNTL